MRDHDLIATSRRQRGVERSDPGNQGGTAFAARRGESGGISRPAIERVARHAIPGQTFPGAEIQFLQARIDDRLGVDCLGQKPAAACRTAPDARRTEPAQPGDNCRDIGGIPHIHIKPAVADTRLDQRRGVADQRDLHRFPPR